VIVIDAHDLGAPDLAVVDALARLQLEARRCGGSIRVVEISDGLRDVLALVGLGDLVDPDGFGRRDGGWQAEQREQGRGVEIGVDRPDPA
jgi:hypothetical protein